MVLEAAAWMMKMNRKSLTQQRLLSHSSSRLELVACHLRRLLGSCLAGVSHSTQQKSSRRRSAADQPALLLLLLLLLLRMILQAVGC
jgi:hypothetical protein